MNYTVKQLLSLDDIMTEVGDKLLEVKTIFSCPLILDVFFHNDFFELWSLKGGNINTLLVKKLRTGEIRILFEIIPHEAIEFIKNVFNPPFICYNLLSSDPKKDNQISTNELVVSIPKLLTLSDGNIRRKYLSAQKKNSDLIFKPYSVELVPDIKKFLKEWEQQLDERKENFVSGIFHDELFLDRYSKNKNIFGICVYDKNKLIAYTIIIRISDTFCVDGFNKCLRNYYQLGLQISIDRSRIASALGYSDMCLGPINNDFKKQFIPFSETFQVYGYEIFRLPTFQTKTPDGYTRMLFSK